MKAVVLVLACVAVAAALSVKSSPEARFMSTEEGLSSGMSAATVVSDRDYAALKHEEAEKAVRALHLPGDKPDLLADLGIDHNSDAEEQANDEELLALAAQTESSDAEDADAAETAAALESEIEAVEAEEDSADVLLEVAEEEEDEEEAEDEDEAEEEAEAEEEDSAEEEDAVFLEVADEEADEDEDEDESEEESEDEADAEDEAEDEESSEDLALIAESEEKPSRYISPVLRPALPSKHNDAMPDATYDKVAETNLFPPAAHLVGAGPKPKPFSPAEIAAADAKIRAARAKKAKAKKLARKSKKAMKAVPRPAAAGKKAARKSRKARRARKNRKAARKSRRGSRKGRKARKSRRGSRKSRRGSRKGRKSRKARRGGRKSRRGGRKSRKSSKKSKKSKKCKKPGDPRCIITAPYLQDIRDARHKHLVKTTNDLINEVDDGILEHMVYPPIADPNKKGCKTKKAKKF